jgi:hypothetical protein
MAFDPAAAEGFVKAHPVGSAIGGLAIVLVIWWALSGSSAAPAPAATGSTNDSSIAAATSIQNAQISAGVANNQTDAQKAISLAQIQGNTDASVAASTAATQVAYYGAATDISNNATTNYQTAWEGQIAADSNANATQSSMFDTLAALVATLETSVTSTNYASNTTTGATTSAQGGNGTTTTGGASSTSVNSSSSASTPAGNAQGASGIAALISSLLQFGSSNTTIQLGRKPGISSSLPSEVGAETLNPTLSFNYTSGNGAFTGLQASTPSTTGPDAHV